jgi:hypothetical protein
VLKVMGQRGGCGAYRYVFDSNFIWLARLSSGFSVGTMNGLAATNGAPGDFE